MRDSPLGTVPQGVRSGPVDVGAFYGVCSESRTGRDSPLGAVPGPGLFTAGLLLRRALARPALRGRRAERLRRARRSRSPRVPGLHRRARALARARPGPAVEGGVLRRGCDELYPGARVEGRAASARADDARRAAGHRPLPCRPSGSPPRRSPARRTSRRPSAPSSSSRRTGRRCTRRSTRRTGCGRRAWPRARPSLPGSNVAEQLAGHEIPGESLETVPLPEPPTATVSANWEPMCASHAESWRSHHVPLWA